MKRKVLWGFLAVCVAAGVLVWSGPSYARDKDILRMATTTSTDNTGLLDYLAPKIKEDTGIELQWVSVGTGNAIALGRNCDVSVLFVHDPDAEKAFVDQGYGIDRARIMYNDFVIIGPKSDPARIGGTSVKDALESIQAQKALFTSRGDNSGTHMAEVGLWKEAGLPVPDKESWYVQTGQGMINTINIAAERDAYTLTDRGTFIKYEANWEGNPPLKILVEGDEILKNQYSVIPVNPGKCPNVDYEKARKLSDWMTSEKGQRIIADFKLLGKQLFYPNAGE